ncbi:MAG: sulfite oxidase-like oxidoreductase [Candidatus Eremiobacteraeota bacterium]|nr:sulfite oxidase-like oxidoreductase [Candidatus Eremiobacteraeota bacterium]
MISRGFTGHRQSADIEKRLPPGQYLVTDFPVLSAGPTPHTPLDRWTFTLEGLVESPVRWSWDEFRKLTSQSSTVDIHCVTKWSKLDTKWLGVSVDTLLAAVKLKPQARYVMAFSDGGYTTNIPLAELVNGQAFVAYQFDDKDLAPEHGGPSRLVVPHLYFWKSAKWIRGLRLMDQDQPGFWESLGYNMHGDPWKEERYSGD